VSRRAQLAAAAVVALVSAVGIGVLVAQWVSRDAPASAPLGLRETDAAAPFAGYREVRLVAGDRCARVVVADTRARRERGLRGADDLGAFAGMLFVQPHDSDVAFTMAGVNVPLDIAWYASDGSRIDVTHMPPCPDHAASACPVYRSRRAYRFALETPAGARAPTHLSPCS
jgi:uncharacterized membrane protein (UPF0127 family)